MSSNRTPRSDAPDTPLLRTPWSRSQRTVARRVVQPLQSFLEQEAASAFLLVVAAVVALVWANSPWRASYEDLWTTSVELRLGAFAIEGDLRSLVNEGLMSLFFLVVGLEVKRELLTGELRDRRAALLPIVGAIGGMVLPALLYLAVTAGTAGAPGWGAAMPTDIAVAAAVLALAWPRSSPGVRVFLLSLAIADDIGSVAVVAVAYPSDLAWGWLGVAALVGRRDRWAPADPCPRRGRVRRPRRRDVARRPRGRGLADPRGCGPRLPHPRRAVPAAERGERRGPSGGGRHARLPPDTRRRRPGVAPSRRAQP